MSSCSNLTGIRVGLLLCLAFQILGTTSAERTCQGTRPCSACTYQEIIENRFCDETGYYTILTCSNDNADKHHLRGLQMPNMANQTSRTPSTKTVVLKESCTLDISGFSSVVRFELLMTAAALYSLNFVWKRKRAAYQRLTNIVNS